MKHLNKEEGGIKILIKDSYLKAIENSIGSRLFKNLYFKSKNPGKKIDALQNGNLSCAVFASWILRNFYLIKNVHSTVKGTIKDLKSSGWREIKKPKIGAVLIWEEKNGETGPHKHLGFYMGKNSAISNSSEMKKPVQHHWTLGNKTDKNYRRVIEIWWHKKLE